MGYSMYPVNRLTWTIHHEQERRDLADSCPALLYFGPHFCSDYSTITWDEPTVARTSGDSLV